MAWGSIQRAGLVLLPLLSIGFLVVRGCVGPDVPFLTRSVEAPWIQAPEPVSAALRQWGRSEVPVTRFSRTLEVAEPTAASVQVRALGGFTLELDGELLAQAPPDVERDWRAMTHVDLVLDPGANELRVEVRNRHGPALLSLRVDGLASSVVSDASWNVRVDAEPRGRARAADDTRVNPLVLAVETPSEALLDRRNVLAVCFLLVAVGVWAAQRRGVGLPSAAGWVAALGASAAWLWLGVEKFLRVPLTVGFDARHHLFYVDFLREKVAVPLATDGWSVYHPPLFYALAAVARGGFEAVAGDDGVSFGLKLIPFLAGLGNVWLAFALCRRLVGSNDAARPLYGLLFAAVLPMNLYTAAYFSNETFHTFVASLALLVVLDLLRAERVSWGQVVGLGVLLGLGLNTKFTTLIVAAVGGFFVFVKLLAVERETLTRASARLAVIGGVALLLGGWFYVRNWLHFGDPLMANWGSMPGATLSWWQQPGFHTLPYFTRFGESLQHPYLSAFHSFWDSVYSTLWGDGGIAGRVSPTDRLGVWNYAYMSAGYLLALPATLLIGVGSVRALIGALRDPDPHRRAQLSFLLTFVYAVGFGLLYLALRLPYFAQGKASYGLVVMAPLAWLFADGLAGCDEALARRGWSWARPVLMGWLAVFVATLFLAYAG